jgi:murein DD-endopeptidase MepM/ murein hydrolase activator NlpD
MNVNNLIAINDLSRPYSIRVGQKLKVGSSVASNKQNSVAYQKSLKSNSSSVKSKPIPELKIANKNNRFSWPVKGAVISKFGPKDGGLYNDGINIKAQNGDSVKSAEDGVVAYVGNELRGYGNLIIVKHAGGWISAYGHLDETKVKRGVNVKKGQTIAQVGSTGNVKSPQLYFGLRKGRDAVNPQKYL